MMMMMRAGTYQPNFENPTWHLLPSSGSWRQFCFHWCMTLDLVTMRVYVMHSLTVHLFASCTNHWFLLFFICSVSTVLFAEVKQMLFVVCVSVCLCVCLSVCLCVSTIIADQNYDVCVCRCQRWVAGEWQTSPTLTSRHVTTPSVSTLSLVTLLTTVTPSSGLHHRSTVETRSLSISLTPSPSTELSVCLSVSVCLLRAKMSWNEDIGCHVGKLRLSVAVSVCLCVRSCATALNSTAIFNTRLYAQVGTGPAMNCSDFQDHGVKGRGHTATNMERNLEILCTQ